MSNQIDQQAIMDSVDVTDRRVHSQAFLSKLAQLGFPAENQQEALDLLQLGWRLEEAGWSPAAAAAPQRSKYANALAFANGQQADGDLAWQQAMALAQDPEVYGAALTIKHAEALVQASEAAGQ